MVLDSYGLMFSEGRRLSVSATMLSIPVVCWILGPKSPSMSIHCMSLWDALIVASWTRFLWSENKSISYPNRITRDYLRHLKIKISSLFVAVKFNFVFGSLWQKNQLVYFIDWWQQPDVYQRRLCVLGYSLYFLRVRLNSFPCYNVDKIRNLLQY